MRRRVMTARRGWGWELGLLAALGGVGLLSLLIGIIERHLQIASISSLYLIVVLAVAAGFGRWPGIVAALVAFVTFNWFFVEPRYTFTVANPNEWVALLVFLMTAIATGQLAATQRSRAIEAAEREREALVLYEVVRLMGEPDLEASLRSVAERLQLELQLDAVVVELADPRGEAPLWTGVGDPQAIRLTESVGVLSARALGAHTSGGRRTAAGRWVRVVPPHAPGVRRVAESDRLYVVPVETEGRRVGALLLVRGADGAPFRAVDDRLLLAVGGQLGLAVERERLRREATETEVLRRTDELKTALLNAASHDLRTPLASIIASAGSLRQTDVAWTDEERQEFAEAIEQEAQRLNRIVGNLLDLSRIEGGSLRPQKDWYSLSALVDDVVGRLRPVTAQHRVVVDVPDDLPPILLGYVEIDQVLSNLVENAVKYTPPECEIRVAARSADGLVEVEVADCGPGIPVMALPRLFRPFYRADGPGPRPKGTGLGLAVARGLVEAHGGRIWAENRREGGARFVFTLPRGGEAATAPRAGGGAGGGGAA